MSDLATLSIRVDSLEAEVAKKRLEGLSSAGQFAEGIIGKLAAAWAAMKLGEHILDVTKLAARYDTLGAVMTTVGNTAGYSSSEMAKFQASLQATGISMIAARDALTMMAGAQLDLQKSSELARIAQDAAVIGGINSSEAFQRMIQGIRSGQTEVLRTIGITVNFEQSYAKLGLTLGKTAKDLTDAEKTTARMNAVMAFGPNIAGAYEAAMGTAGKQALSMERYIEDLKVTLGDLFQPAYSAAVLSLTESLKEMKEWFSQNAIAVDVTKENIRQAGEQFSLLVTELYAAASGTKDVTGELTLMEIATKGVAVGFAILRDGVQVSIGEVELAMWSLLKVFNLVTEAQLRLISGPAAWFNYKPPQWLQELKDMQSGGTDEALKKMRGGALEAVTNGQTPGESSDDKDRRKLLDKFQEGNRIADGIAMRAQIAKDSKKSPTVGADPGLTQYGKELQRLSEEALALTQGERAAYEMKLKLMDNAAKGDVSKAMGLWDANRALEAHKASMGADIDEMGAWIESMNKLKQDVDLVGASIEAQVRAKYRNTNATEAMIQYEIQLRENMVKAEDVKRLREEVEQLNRAYEDSTPEGKMKNLDKKNATGLLDPKAYAAQWMEIKRTSEDIQGQMVQASEFAADRIANGFADMAVGVQSSFREMASGILKEVARMMAQKAVASLLNSFISWAWSGGTGAPTVETSTAVPSGGTSTIPTGGSTWGGIGGITPGTSGTQGVNISIVVNGQTGSTQTSAKGDAGKWDGLSQQVKGLVLQTLTEEKRLGNSLNPVFAR